MGDELVKSADVEALSSIVVVTAATADSELVMNDGDSAIELLVEPGGSLEACEAENDKTEDEY